MTTELERQFGAIDIYLFDQLLRGRVARGSTVLDAGCGTGRNLVYLMREGYNVFAADPDERAIAAVRRMAAEISPALPAENFRAERVEAMTFPDGFADMVVCIAVLHFASDDAQFEAMLRGAWRTLAPGGIFVCRLASSIGIEDRVRRIAGRRSALPDGTERYLVDEALLLALTRDLGGALLDPLKTTIVQNQRAMTTWVVLKHA